MPPRKANAANDAAMFAEAERHGGLVALVGGPAHANWYFRDEFLARSPVSWVRDGYVESREQIQNPDVDCRPYGLGTVWRFDPAAVTCPEPGRGQVEPLPVVLCGCGERLLLLVPGRDLCERCRIERGLPQGWWRDAAVA